MTFISNKVLPFSLLLIFLMACNSPTIETEDSKQSSTQIDSTQAKTDSLSTIEDDEPEVIRLNAKELSVKNRLPTELDYAGEEELEEGDIPDVVVRFFPLGWSSEGDFAFLEYSITYHEGHLLEYKIYKRDQDTSKILKSTIYAIQPASAEFPWETGPDVIIQSEKELSEAKAFELLWAAGESEIMALLEKHKINYQPTSDFMETSSYKGLEFSIREEGDEMDRSYYISNGKKEKLIAQGIYPEIKNISFLGVLEDSKKEHYLLLALKKGQFFEMTDELSLLLSAAP